MSCSGLSRDFFFFFSCGGFRGREPIFGSLPFSGLPLFYTRCVSQHLRNINITVFPITVGVRGFNSTEPTGIGIGGFLLRSLVCFQNTPFPIPHLKYHVGIFYFDRLTERILHDFSISQVVQVVKKDFEIFLKFSKPESCFMTSVSHRLFRLSRGI